MFRIGFIVAAAFLFVFCGSEKNISACHLLIAEAENRSSLSRFPTAIEVQKFLDAVKGTRILVVGDHMLDRMIVGTSTRQSPEAPIPVVDVVERIEAPGGAANVAIGLKRLGLEVVSVGIIGGDADGGILQRLLEINSVRTQLFVFDRNRRTLTKERVYSNGVPQLRLDEGSLIPIEDQHADAIFSSIEKMDFDALVLSDYAKGVLISPLTQRLIAWARRKNIPIVVDPKGKNFEKYRGATLVKPNRKEALALFPSTHNIDEAGLRWMASTYNIRHPMVTLSEEGVMWIDEANKWHQFIPPRVSAFDVVGAGDTVTAVIAAGLAAGLALNEIVPVASFAASIAIQSRGTHAVSQYELLSAASP